LAELLTTTGGIISLTSTIIMLVLYILMFGVALYFDRRDRASEYVPDIEDIKDFVEKFNQYALFS